MRKIMGAAALLLASLSCYAVTFATDVSDIWWNPGESGWGVNVIHQGDTLFATLFVYGTTGAPNWYVASAVTYVGQQGASLVYSGPLYQTSGPWFGGPFNPDAVGIREVGAATFTFDAIDTGSVAYTVDGVGVTKQITRQTWRSNDLGGNYLGATAGAYSGCPFGPSGYTEGPALISISHATTTISMTATGSDGASCTYRGTYSQAGRMGRISGGTLSCSDGTTGAFSAFEVEGSISGFTARAALTFAGTCRWDGRIGGVRRGF